MKNLINRILLISLVLVFTSSCGSSLATNNVSIEAWSFDVPTEWKSFTDENVNLYTWYAENNEAGLIVHIKGSNGYNTNALVSDLFNTRYDQRTYGKNDYATDSWQETSIKGMDKALYHRYAGLLSESNEILYDIDVYDIKAPYKNEYDESLQNNNIVIIFFVDHNSADKNNYKATLSKIIKTVKVDPDKYQAY